MLGSLGSRMWSWKREGREPGARVEAVVGSLRQGGEGAGAGGWGAWAPGMWTVESARGRTLSVGNSPDPRHADRPSTEP